MSKTGNLEQEGTDSSVQLQKDYDALQKKHDALQKKHDALAAKKPKSEKSSEKDVHEAIVKSRLINQENIKRKKSMKTLVDKFLSDFEEILK